MPSTSRPGSSLPRLRHLGLLPLCLALAACGDSAEPPPAADVQRVPAAAAAWAPRLAQGMDTLLDHSINGYKGMPPMGMCMQCSEEQFRALIEFMSAAQDR
ncbi:cytochrome C [Pseudomonas aeruginosa VRFPA01]|nr:cytochrome C [Pseudomonas aeruginosa VRFPA01]